MSYIPEYMSEFAFSLLDEEGKEQVRQDEELIERFLTDIFEAEKRLGIELMDWGGTVIVKGRSYFI